MKKPKVDMNVDTATLKEVANRSLELARKLDRGEKVKPEYSLTFEDPIDLMRILSAQRMRIIQCLRMNPVPIAELASILKRDRKAVSRDVKLLESFGLVTTTKTKNPGHGTMKIVKPTTQKIHFTL